MHHFGTQKKEMRYKTPNLVRALGRRDHLDDQRKKDGFQVFVKAIESYCSEGLHDGDIQSKALS